MLKEKADVIQLVMEPYSLTILTSLQKGMQRFRDLQKLTKNDRTLSSKLLKLRKQGLITTKAVEKDGKFFTGYQITAKGSKVLKGLERLDIS